MTAKPKTVIIPKLLCLLAIISLSGCLSSESSSLSGERTTADATGGTPQNGNSRPSISGNPPRAVSVDRAFVFTPTSSDPDGDALSFSVQGLPSWADFDTSSGLISGVPHSSDVGVYTGITIRVSDGSLSASLPAFSVEVIATGAALGSAALSWSAPTQNEDGSPLTDLAGFRLYWGRLPGGYTDSLTLANPGATSVVIDDLAPGSYEFAATAFNEAGIESAFSAPAQKTIM